MAHTELNLRERRAIEDMLNAKMSVDKIAGLGCLTRSNLYLKARVSLEFIHDFVVSGD